MMVKKSMIVGIMLVGVMAFGAEKPASKSDSSKSSDKSPSRPCSQEFAKKAAVPAVAHLYYDSPCGVGRVGMAFQPDHHHHHHHKPYPYLPWDFPH